MLPILSRIVLYYANFIIPMNTMFEYIGIINYASQQTDKCTIIFNFAIIL